MRKKKLVSFIIVFLIATFSTVESWGQYPDEYVVIAGGEVQRFTPQAELGYVVKSRETQAAIQALGSVLNQLRAEDVRPIRGLGRQGISVVSKNRKGYETEQAMSSLRANYQIAYVAPLFTSNGETIAIIPEIVVRLTNEYAEDQLEDLCLTTNFSIIRQLEFTNLEYLIDPSAKTADEVFQAIEQLNEVDFIEWAVPNVAFRPRLQGQVIPDDTYFPDQWHLNNTGQSGGTADADINAPEAWEITTGDPSIIIAVLDEGVDTDHPDLINNIVAGYDFYDDDNDPNPTGDDAHGTACAGLIAAQGNNALGVTGVAWNSKIMPIRIAGGTGFITDADIATAIRWAANNGADILSNSWGGSSPMPTIQSAIQDVTEPGGIGRDGKGCVFLAASGNWSGGGPVMYPAKYSEVIAVGATNHNDTIWNYSGHGSELDIVAPSGDTDLNGNIWTTDIVGNDGYNNRDNGILDYTDKMGGTSASCPIAAGVAALILSVDGNLTNSEVQNILQISALDLGDPGKDDYYGYGRIDAYGSLTMIFSGLIVKLPNGGETWLSGFEYDIKWISVDGGPTVDIYLLKGGVFYTQLADNVPNVGRFAWEIPESTPTGADYQILVDDGTNSDESDADFAIRPIEIYVDDDAPEGGDGASWDTAFKYLQDALVVAQYGVEIRVAEGNYKPDPSGLDDPRKATFQLVNGVIIEGGYVGYDAPDPNERNFELYVTILSGDLLGNDVFRDDPAELHNDPYRVDNNYHVVTCSGVDSNTILDGFIITGGNADGSGYHNHGGGMYNDDHSSPTITNCIFTSNSARDYGGGMYIYSSSPTVTGCTFSGNSSDYGGGGIYNGYDSSPNLTDCTFSGNSAGVGGGLYNFISSPTVTNCIFSGNSAEYGGGMFIYWYSSPTVTTCTFTGNSADNHGGGMDTGHYSSPTVTNCSFYKNSAGKLGGGMINELSSLTLTNCILWDNIASDGPQIYLSNSTASINYSDVQGGWDGLGNIDIDPNFVDPGYWDPNGTPGNPDDDYWMEGDHHLRWHSPCINAGDPDNANYVGQLDIDGEPRIMLGRVDMGADEVCEKQADFNRNGIINLEDFAIFTQAWKSAPGDDNWYILCDLFEDKRIDMVDLFKFLQDWLWQAPWYAP